MDKLYVITRAQLNPIYQCVQGGHAVAQWMYDNKDNSQYKEWSNGYLIYLNTFAFDDLLDTVKNEGLNVSEFKEPDMGNITTAFAVFCDGIYFQDLKLVR